MLVKINRTFNKDNSWMIGCVGKVIKETTAVNSYGEDVLCYSLWLINPKGERQHKYVAKEFCSQVDCSNVLFLRSGDESSRRKDKNSRISKR